MGRKDILTDSPTVQRQFLHSKCSRIQTQVFHKKSAFLAYMCKNMAPTVNNPINDVFTLHILTPCISSNQGTSEHQCIMRFCLAIYRFTYFFINFFKYFFSMLNGLVTQWPTFGPVRHPREMITFSTAIHLSRKYQSPNDYRIGTKQC